MKFVCLMERSDFASLLFILWDILWGYFSHLTKKSSYPLGKYIKKGMNFYLKEISKIEIGKLIKAGYLKNTGQGYVNPKKNYRVGYYKTCGGHRYIEDWYSDKAKQLR